MLRLLQLTDKEKMLELVNKTQMFEAEELSFIADTFEEESSEAIWFGKFDNELMIGVAYCLPMEMTNATWNVLMLLVDPKHHRSGIGRDLMQLMESTLTKQGQRLLIVETSSTDDFQTARSFYSAIGYAQQGAIEHYYDDNDHKITFIKRL
ncbi:histone acetyltransferase HPA2 and related acetyltransferases [Vibrio maritimus]|uniref:Histone acetyltransferase HPA2 and related acetyltransferases n=1 Tax=Vibrio maritimus TaxID=990268 RepID=A0A090T967_9VIBR|nr:histone acetyltransferase HPA2 and related acetyltransferases [Vibrio maritimus]